MTYLVILLKDRQITGLYTASDGHEHDWEGYAYEDNFDFVKELGLTSLNAGLFGKRYAPAYVARSKYGNQPFAIYVDQKDLWVDFHNKYKREDELIG